MNPADKRLSELLDKWLTSLELHLKYSGLDEDGYRKIQPWPAHDRPSRWIIELARQKLLSLKEQHDSRVAMGDAKFADALENTPFLANLVGAENIKRFIPLADPKTEVPREAQPADNSSTSQKTVIVPIVPAMLGTETTQISALATKPHKMIQAAHDVTREMPQPKLGSAGLPPSAPRRSSSATRAGAKTSTRRESRASAETTAQREKLVLDDATRLLGWGRKWHELAELISRMADRPSVTEVRRILREHKTALDRAN